MKRKIAVLWMMFLCTQSLAGCQKTPDDVIVTEKNKDNMSNYETAEDTGTSLGKEINAPGNYKNELSFQDGALKIDTDAEVVIPDVDSVDTISVCAMELNQEMIDKITKVFFGDAPVYDGNKYYTLSRTQIEQQIVTLKNYVAQGNMDPYNYNSGDEVGEDYISGMIADYERMQSTAPETVEKKQVKPQFGLSSDYPDENGNIKQQTMDNLFMGVAETEKGIYEYGLQRDNEDQILFLARITQIQEKQDLKMQQRWISAGGLLGADGYISDKGQDAKLSVDEIKVLEGLLAAGGDMPDKKRQGFTFSMTEDEIKQLTNVSYEDAKAIADEKVKALGLIDMEINEWEYSICYEGDKLQKENIIDGAYNFHYTRKPNGFPVSSTMNAGGATEKMESTVIPWGYEVVDIIVGDDGVMDVAINNLYDMGEVVKENVKLMKFEDIIKIYEQMMEVTNADLGAFEKQRTYHITKIKLGYSRIYDPRIDNKTGVLVPVWDFYGGIDVDNKDGSSCRDNGKYSNQSFMTINAVDGTVIDRDLGY